MVAHDICTLIEERDFIGRIPILPVLSMWCLLRSRNHPTSTVYRKDHEVMIR